MGYQVELYHYVHCPFCIRVRMAFGFLGLKFQSIVLPYHDEKTPLDLCGIKMLPIIKTDEFSMNESLDIIKKFDTKNLLSIEQNQLDTLNELTNSLGKEIHSLAMPYFIWTQEFDENSRTYFQTKKEKKRGPFIDLLKQQKNFLNSLDPKLNEVEYALNTFYQNDQFGLKDIILASHLWALFIVPEFQFSSDIYHYLQRVKKATSFDYHEDYKRS